MFDTGHLPGRGSPLLHADTHRVARPAVLLYSGRRIDRRRLTHTFDDPLTRMKVKPLGI